MASVIPSGHTLGATIDGFILARLSAEEFDVAMKALGDYGVLRFPRQELTPRELKDFSARFGELKVHITKKAQHPRYPMLMVMDNRTLDTKKGEEKTTAPLLVRIGNVWHTDTSYDYVTAKATGMYCSTFCCIGSMPGAGGCSFDCANAVIA